MRIGYSEDEPTAGNHTYADPRVADANADSKAEPAPDSHDVDDRSLTEPGLDNTVNHVTSGNTLDPPTQLITCRHWLVWPVAFLYIVAYNCTFYVFGQYVYIKLQREKFPNVTIETVSVCAINTSSPAYLVQLEVQQTAATWAIYLYTSGGIVTALAVVMRTYKHLHRRRWSQLCESHLKDNVISICNCVADVSRFGRKFLFILPLLGTTVRTAMAAVGIRYDLPLQYHMIGYFIEGCTGQIFTVFLISFVYVSDITPVGKMRSIGIVVIEVAFGLGTALISLGAGFLLKFTNFLVPYYFSLILLGITLILVLFLPETYPKEVRVKRKYTSNFENLKDAVDLYFSSKNAGRRWMYIVTLTVFTLASYNLFGRNAIEGLYLLNAPFCWGPDKIGIFGALKSGIQQLLGMGMVAVFQRFMGDKMIAIVGCVSYGLSFLLEGLATNDLMLYIVAVIGVCGLLTIPMVRSLMSQMTSPHKQGAVFASISLAESLISLISAVTANSVYIISVSVFRGLIFIVFASFSAIGCIIMTIFYFGTRDTNIGPDEDETLIVTKD